MVGLTAVTILMADLVLAARGLSGIEGKIFRTSISLIAFRRFINPSRCRTKTWRSRRGELSKGLGGVGVIIGE